MLGCFCSRGGKVPEGFSSGNLGKERERFGFVPIKDFLPVK